MSFKSCDPGIVFELRLSESSARECLRSPPMFVCMCANVCVWSRGEDLVFLKFTSCRLFWMIIVVERKDEIHLKLNKKIEQEGIKGGFEDSTERENKLNLQTK